MSKVKFFYPTIHFVSVPKYNMSKQTYFAAWEKMGNSIIEAFTIISHIPFTEKKIIARVGAGDENGSNFAGVDTSSPMLFRYNVRDKLGTLVHEFGHRLIMEHDYYEKAKKNLQLYNEHQLLNLFLYDVIVKVFGKEAALYRVEYERSFPDIIYDSSWKWALEIPKKERQKILKNLALEFT